MFKGNGVPQNSQLITPGLVSPSPAIQKETNREPAHPCFNLCLSDGFANPSHGTEMSGVPVPTSKPWSVRDLTLSVGRREESSIQMHGSGGTWSQSSEFVRKCPSVPGHSSPKCSEQNPLMACARSQCGSSPFKGGVASLSLQAVGNQQSRPVNWDRTPEDRPGVREAESAPSDPRGYC